jgi:Haem-binding domain
MLHGRLQDLAIETSPAPYDQVMRGWRLYALLTFAALAGFSIAIDPRPGSPPSNPLRSLERTGSVPPDVMSILRRSCYDCHSNETRWPWYSRIAPVSFLLARDVRAGRETLNFSELGRGRPGAKADWSDVVSTCGVVVSGVMPPWRYRILHPEARLNTSQTDRLCSWAERQPQLQTHSPT